MPINISTSPSVFRWKPACWLCVTGEDAAAFLQGQFSNDVRLLEHAPVVYGLWLTLKGKVLADSFLLRGRMTDEFWIGSYFSSASVIRERLEGYVIADDVVIEDRTAEWSGTTVISTGIPAPSHDEAVSTDFVFPGRRARSANLECVYRIADGEPKWISVSDAVVVDEEQMMRRRIEAGIPAIPTEIGPADLPNEGGLEADAISYTKGCYLGQEVMARLKSMGQVRRRLWRVSGCGESLPVAPAAVFAGSRQVGELRSAVRDGAGGWLGMVMVSLMHAAPEMELSFASGGAPAMRLFATP